MTGLIIGTIIVLSPGFLRVPEGNVTHGRLLMPNCLTASACSW